MAQKASRKHSKARVGDAQNDSILGIPSDDTVFLLPWYLPKSIYLEVRSVLPNIHIAKMRYYFDDYGCIRCERRDALYKANGMCTSCNTIVRFRLAQCLKKRLKRVGIEEPQQLRRRLDGGMKLAQEMLKPFHQQNRK